MKHMTSDQVMTDDIYRGQQWRRIQFTVLPVFAFVDAIIGLTL